MAQHSNAKAKQRACHPHRALPTSPHYHSQEGRLLLAEGTAGAKPRAETWDAAEVGSM